MRFSTKRKKVTKKEKAPDDDYGLTFKNLRSTLFSYVPPEARSPKPYARHPRKPKPKRIDLRLSTFDQSRP